MTDPTHRVVSGMDLDVDLESTENLPSVETIQWEEQIQMADCEGSRYFRSVLSRGHALLARRLETVHPNSASFTVRYVTIKGFSVLFGRVLVVSKYDEAVCVCVAW